MTVVGITGGIGSGKTTVCRFLEGLGARVFYSDDEAKRLMVEDVSLRQELTSAFGSETYRSDGTLDRPFLAGRVFGDAAELERLNSLVHPSVFSAFADFVADARTAGVRLVVRESAVFPEGKGREGLDLVVSVTTPQSVRVARVVDRDQTTPERVLDRMGHQLADPEYASRADRILRNDGDLAQLEQKARRLYRDLTISEATPISMTDHPYPPLATELPTWGNAFMRFVGRLGLGLAGFRITGSLPKLKKFVFIGAPHTSNWDFIIAMLTLFALGLRVNWVGKHTIFRPPFGPFMRWLGGIPIDRAKTRGFVEQVCDAISESDQMIVGLAPEGTRKRVDRWKTGFYRIATGAGIPIVLGVLDFKKRELNIGTVFHPTGDLEADMESIRSHYQDAKGLYPDQYDPG